MLLFSSVFNFFARKIKYKIMNEFQEDVKPNINQQKDSRLLVVDINYLLSEFKDKPVETVKSELEGIFQVKVFFIDGSMQNIQGSSNNNYKPVYFI